MLDTVAAHGIATVLSVGAGLDTRPWRLELPAALRWIEVDFPEMLDYKDGVMAAAVPKCHRERLAADVNDPAGRQSVFAAAGAGPTLMITEGLLMYLPAATIEALAANTAVSYWMLDVATAEDDAQGANGLTSRSRTCARPTTSMAADNRRPARPVAGPGSAASAMPATSMDLCEDRVFAMFRDVPPDQLPKPLPATDPSGVHLFGQTIVIAASGLRQYRHLAVIQIVISSHHFQVMLVHHFRKDRRRCPQSCRHLRHVHADCIIHGVARHAFRRRHGR